MVSGPGERDHAVRGDRPVGGFDRRDSARTGGQSCRPSGVTAQSEGHEAGRESGCTASRRTPGREPRVPGVADLWGCDPDRELVGVRVTHEYRAGLVEPPPHPRVTGCDVALEHPARRGQRQTGYREDVLERDRQPAQRGDVRLLAARAGETLPRRISRLVGEFGIEPHPGTDVTVEGAGAAEARLEQLAGVQQAGAQERSGVHGAHQRGITGGDRLGLRQYVPRGPRGTGRDRTPRDQSARRSTDQLPTRYWDCHAPTRPRIGRIRRSGVSRCDLFWKTGRRLDSSHHPLPRGSSIHH